MASADVTLKVSSTLQSLAASNNGSKYPDSYSLELTCKKRIENQVRTIAGSGTLTLVAADEGLTGINFFKLEVLTAGKNVNIKFDGDANGIKIEAPSTTSKGVIIGSTNFATAVITNLETTDVDIQFSIYEKKA